MSIEQLKALDPAYANIPDGEFAYRVWNSEKERNQGNQDLPGAETSTPMGVWADEHNIDNDTFKAMIAFSSTQGYTPTDHSFSPTHTPEGSQGRAFLQGQTFGYGDEIVGGGAAALDYLFGDSDKSFEELYISHRDNEREKLQQFRSADPVGALSYEVAGAIASPVKIKFGKKDSGRNVKNTAAEGFGYGALYGSGSSDGDVKDRAKNAITTGVTASLFGVGFEKTVSLSGAAAKKLAEQFGKNKKEPTIEGLRTAKNIAYMTVDKAKVKFGSKDLAWLSNESKKIAVSHHYSSFKESAITGVMNMINSAKTSGKNLSLTQLDKMKQTIYAKYTAHPEQKALKEMADAIDELILSKSAEYPSLVAARSANAAYKKAEKVEEYLKKAKINQMGPSGTTIVNTYTGAIANLLNNKKDIRWFSEGEQAILKQFVKGNTAQRVVRRVGGYSPSINHLLGVLGMTGWFVNKAFIIPAAMAAISKVVATADVKIGAKKLVESVGGIEKKPMMVPPMTTSVVSKSSAVNQQQ